MFPNIFLYSSLVTLAFAQTCYWRNGTAQDDLDYQPCSSNASDPLSHICCSSSRDICLPNGLCKTLYTEDTYIYFRESCTLSNWESGGCQELCSDTTGQRAGDANVTPCDGTDTSEQWCCGNSTACCEDASFGSHSVAPVFLGVITSSSSSSIPSATSTSVPLSSSSSSSTPTPLPTTTPSNGDNRGLSTGAKAGIGVGAAVGVIALIALGVFIGRRSHKKGKETAEATSYYEPVKAEFPSEYRHEAPALAASMHEAPVRQTPVELPGVPIKPQELPGPGR
ncbi:hypothetical protein G6011_00841 [Alternaria panax]|uniref:Mid2 domain-containing protein n=1 Tax=Alternaria panax TaxID=48097 RepID=A0AAD4IJD2_9PLEO|nr:hypothetical protein G6011_00841 [Alternaria panax]